MTIFEELLSKYELNTNDDVINATRELMQEIALAALYRGDFFEKAAFYGGTCLRIFHNLERFSEDMDFSLLREDKNFSLTPYFNNIVQEFESLGLAVEITSKQKTKKTAIESVFLKRSLPIYNIQLQNNKNIKIKFEVDINPPLGFSTENKLLLQPFSFFVKTYTLPDLFAGKMHALLFRSWKNRVKGRDWYDFEWYIKKGVRLNLRHFAIRAYQSGHINTLNLSKEDFLKLLITKITNLNIDLAKVDILPFIKDRDTLTIWSNEYFLTLLKFLKIEE